MTQLETAVGGSDNNTVVAAEPTIEDRFTAITKKEDEDEPQSEDDQLAQIAQEDDTPDEPDEPDAPEAEQADDEPAIAPPVSWTAEEKAEFEGLPRALQETLTRREAEREKGVQVKLQEAARVRQEVQTQAVSEVAALREQQLAQFAAILPEIPDEPSEYLRAENPYQFAAEMENRKAIILQHQYAAEVIQASTQRVQQLEAGLKQQQAAANAQLLQEHFPEFLDPAKRPELHSNLRSTALALGYSDSALAHTDATDILAIKTASEWKAKADRLDKLMSKQMSRVREGKQVPKVSRPGVPQGKGMAENQRYASDRAAMRDGDKAATTRVFARFL